MSKASDYFEKVYDSARQDVICHLNELSLLGEISLFQLYKQLGCCIYLTSAGGANLKQTNIYSLVKDAQLQKTIKLVKAEWLDKDKHPQDELPSIMPNSWHDLWGDIASYDGDYDFFYTNALDRENNRHQIVITAHWGLHQYLKSPEEKKKWVSYNEPHQCRFFFEPVRENGQDELINEFVKSSVLNLIADKLLEESVSSVGFRISDVILNSHAVQDMINKGSAENQPIKFYLSKDDLIGMGFQECDDYSEPCLVMDGIRAIPSKEIPYKWRIEEIGYIGRFDSAMGNVESKVEAERLIEKIKNARTKRELEHKRINESFAKH
jgi:hypothetical protein